MDCQDEELGVIAARVDVQDVFSAALVGFEGGGLAYAGGVEHQKLINNWANHK